MEEQREFCSFKLRENKIYFKIYIYIYSKFWLTWIVSIFKWHIPRCRRSCVPIIPKCRVRSLLHWRRCWDTVGNHRTLQTRSSITWAYIIDGCRRSVGRCGPVLCRRIGRHWKLADVACCTSMTIQSDLLRIRRSWWLVLVINQWLIVSLEAAVKLRGGRLRINRYGRWS